MNERDPLSGGPVFVVHTHPARCQTQVRSRVEAESLRMGLCFVPCLQGGRMYRIWLQLLCWISLPLLGLGCSLRESRIQFDADLDRYREVAQATEYPQAIALANNHDGPPAAPHTIRDPAAPAEVWNLSLAEAVELAIANSTVMRDLGGAIIQVPTAARTIYEPTLESSDPRRGMEAALSAFDASVATRLFFDRNDRLLNNFFSAAPLRSFASRRRRT